MDERVDEWIIGLYYSLYLQISWPEQSNWLAGCLSYKGNG